MTTHEKVLDQYGAYVRTAADRWSITAHDTRQAALGAVVEALGLEWGDTTDEIGDDLSDEVLEQRIKDHCSKTRADYQVWKLDV